ncbi:zinc ribbon domain-containing protein [Anaerotardibacter muris]|uniref:zinc ribbon domain-containing protein n=1 Tax=Anaerotardibacter muris TaxID=2941505 RepID=UPI00203F0DC8|nr:zinc ribbon domain-containing protein [Anaerotardibacter muris]
MPKCPECHSKISDSALVCPHCGFQASGKLVPINNLTIAQTPFVLAVPETDVMQNGLMLLSKDTNEKLVDFITNADNASRLFPAIYETIKK